ncbi:MAG: ROK family protein [Bowdeniella nasicola]|nr:ROK family protein [Bowdeniella nasicola]
MPQRSVRAESLRAMNMQLVLAHALAAPKPLSRAQIASEAGITRATSSRLGDELVAADILTEVAPPPATGPGRPGLGLVGSHSRIGIGVDIGVDAIRVVALNLAGGAVAAEVHEADLTQSDPTTIAALTGPLVEHLVAALPDHSHICGLTLALPGLVNDATGRLLDAPNLGWQNVDIPALFLPYLPGGLPAPRVGNEANLAALTCAYRAPGAPSDLQTFAYLSGGIGVGAAIVNRGRLVAGEHGWAGEIGHLTVDPHGPTCRCGSRGCLERYVGAEALAVAFDDDGALDASARALGIALSSLVNILDLPAIVFGGHLGTLLERRRSVIMDELTQRAMAARYTALQLLPAPEPESAAARGAAYASFAGILKNPASYVA